MKKLLVVIGIFLYGLFLVPSITSAATQTFNYPGTYPTVITTSSPTSANVTITFPVKNRKIETEADICVFNDAETTCDHDAHTGGLGTSIFYKNIPIITQNSDLKVSFPLTNLDPTKAYYVNFTVHYKKSGGIHYTSSYSSHFSTEAPDSFNYTFDAQTSGHTINATLGGATGSRSKYQLIIQDTPFVSDIYTPKKTTGIPNAVDPAIQVPDSKGTVSWSIDEIYDHTYYVRVVELSPSLVTKPTYATPAKTVTTEQPTLFFNHLTTEMQGTTVFVEGQIDTNKQPNYLSYKATLTVSKNADLSNPIQTKMPSLQAAGIGAPTGISNGMDNGQPTPEDPAGSYYWVLTGVVPGATYYMQQTITLDNVSVKDRIESFSGTTGAIIPPTTTGTGSATGGDLNQGTYNLLSKGFPGLTSLPDPITCAALTLQNKRPQFCDLNDILNYFLKLMIGISGIFLVVQLMIQGYIIMTTDVPFLRAGAKSTFFSGLLGLLLVLTSYILLNTINPKLVSEDLTISQLSISIPGADGIGTMGISGVAKSASDISWLRANGRPIPLTLKSGSTVSVAPCDPSQIATIPVAVFGHTGVQVQKNLIASVERISAKWEQMSPRYPVKVIEGYNCRTIANSNKISYHSYGMAIDINPDTNGQNKSGNKGDMPNSFITLWTSEGWGWGGNWKSSQDPMHFSKVSGGEQGDLKGE